MMAPWVTSLMVPLVLWFWRSILLALGLHHHEGSGGRSSGLWQRSRGPSHTRLYWLWILSTSYSGYTHHQLDHQCDQGKLNWWVVSLLEWIKDSPIVGLSVSRTFNSVGKCCKQKSGSDHFEQGSQNNKEGIGRCFFIQNNTWPNKTLLLGNNMHIMTRSLNGGDGPYLPHGLSVVNMYTKAISGSKWVAVVVKTWWPSWSLLPRVLKSPKL